MGEQERTLPHVPAPPVGQLRKMPQLDLGQLGHTIQISGVVYGSVDELYLCLLPEEAPADPERPVHVLQLSHEDWKAVIRQTDLLETEVLAQAEDGQLLKAILRKSTRQIEQGLSWNVYRRDGYRCRYCGNDKVPLTVDHLVLWEDGGPSIEANLVACCRKCNKARGRMQYGEWLQSPFYSRMKQRLPISIQEANEALLATLDAIPRKLHRASR